MTNIKYPAQIDDSNSLPEAVNNVTPVDNVLVNKLRSSLLAIENELGVKPSATYGTVKGRLDYLTNVVANAINITFAGDLAGTGASQTVLKINGVSVPAGGSGSLIAGRVLTVVDGYTADYAPLDLSNPNSTIGALPAVNQLPQLLGGDLSGATDSATVIKIRGNSVAAQSLSAAEDGYVLTWSNSDGYYKVMPQVGGGGFSAGNDLSGSSISQTVVKISGTSPVTLTPELRWTDSSSAIISQSDLVSGSAASMLIKSQTSLSGTGGNLVLQSGAGTTTNGGILFKNGSNTNLSMDGYGVITVGTFSAGIVHSDSFGKLSSSLITNNDISSSAAIAPGKITSGLAGQILLNNSTPTPTWTTVSGDATISNTGAVSVVKIRGNNLASQTLNAAHDGYVLTWSNADGYYVAKPGGGFTVGGDLSGSSGSQSVIKIRGNSVASQSLGAAQDGYVLTWSNSDGYYKAKNVLFNSSGTTVLGGSNGVTSYDGRTGYTTDLTRITKHLSPGMSLSGGSTTAISRLSFNMTAGETWIIEYHLMFSGYTGASIYFTAPGGSTVHSGSSLVTFMISSADAPYYSSRYSPTYLTRQLTSFSTVGLDYYFEFRNAAGAIVSSGIYNSGVTKITLIVTAGSNGAFYPNIYPGPSPTVGSLDPGSHIVAIRSTVV